MVAQAGFARLPGRALRTSMARQRARAPNVIERAVILWRGLGGSSTSVCPKARRGRTFPATTVQAPSAPVASAASGEILPLDELEKRHLLMVLERCGGNRTQAAKLLGISVRTMRNKLHEYNVSGQDEAEAAEAPASPPASS